MDDYARMTNKELENEMSLINKEFNDLKNAIVTGLKRLESLSSDYDKIKKEMSKRGINGIQ